MSILTQGSEVPCFTSVQEAGRLFCSKCGNAALQKVEVLVGSDGAEQYGVRKKHIIRGTRFPLPKPHVSTHTPAMQKLNSHVHVVCGLLQLCPCSHSTAAGALCVCC